MSTYLAQQQALAVGQPRLLVAPDIRPAFAPWFAAPEGQWQHRVDPELPEGRWGQIWLDRSLDTLPQAEAQALIGRLKNLHADNIWLLVEQPPWPLATYLALGFVQVATDDFAPARVYSYQLQDYNAARPWNNAKYWANPQNFHRYRW